MEVPNGASVAVFPFGFFIKASCAAGTVAGAEGGCTMSLCEAICRDFDSPFDMIEFQIDLQQKLSYFPSSVIHSGDECVRQARASVPLQLVHHQVSKGARSLPPATPKVSTKTLKGELDLLRRRYRHRRRRGSASLLLCDSDAGGGDGRIEARCN